MIPLTDEENKSYEKQEVCHICKKHMFVSMKIKMMMIKMRMMKILKRLKTTVITQKHLEELLIAFAI